MHCQQQTAATSGLPGARSDGADEAGYLSAASVRTLRRGRAAFALLLEAFSYARDLQRPAWDFAVEIATLHQTGLTASALRWLVCKGYVEHACELPTQNGAARSFHRNEGLHFCSRTCFILTEAGIAFAHDTIAQSSSDEFLDDAVPEYDDSGSEDTLRPIWDGQRRQLRVGRVIVKQFKVPAANQEAVLATFEEEGWPVRVDDPLTPHPKQNAKRRLHDTINSLNRNQRHPRLRFMGDGSGEGVRWSLLPPGKNGDAKIDSDD